MIQLFLDEALSFIVILNPFALCLYLTGLMDELEDHEFIRVIAWASMLSLSVFVLFAFMGHLIVTRIFGVDAEALRIFGGIVIGIIAYGYVTRGFKAVEQLRGNLEELPSAIAVPFMVGAGSLTKAILMGERQSSLFSVAVITSSVIAGFVLIMVFWGIRHRLRRVQEKVFDRYINLLSRINGLLLGAVAMDMIVTGIRDVWEA